MKAKRFLALLICALMIISLASCAKDTYKEANDLMANGSYEEALEQFNTILDYEDSAEKAAECEKNIAYNSAEKLFESGKYEEAMTAFEALADFKDSKQKYNESAYQIALAAFDKEDYRDAREKLTALSDYIADNDEAKEKLRICSTKILKQYILDNGVEFDKLGSDFTDVLTLLDTDATYIKKEYKNDRDETYSLLACATEDSDSMKIIYFSTRFEKQSAGTVRYVSTADMPLESGSFPGVYGVFICYLENGSKSEKILGLVGSFFNEEKDDTKTFNITTANKDSEWIYGNFYVTLEDEDAKNLTAATSDNMKYIFENSDDLLSDAGVTLKDIGFEAA